MNEPRAMATLVIPTVLRAHTGGRARLELPARTVEDALAALEEAFPEAGARVRTGLARRYVILAVGGQDVRHAAGHATPIEEGQELELVWAVAGG